MKITAKGQVLPIVMLTLVVLSIIIYGMVNWVQNDSRWSVKQQKTTSAINLAEAALDRGQWKLQSTTATWAAAAAGTIIPGYNFDTTYYDIAGGSYRIKFANAGSNTLTIIGEGRDDSTKEVRALSAVYKNQTIYSAMMSGGNVSWSPGLGVFWGPIISQGNINLQNGIDAWYFPQKYAKGVVIGTAANPRDINGLDPPNTDNVEWWSEYSGVPNVPVLDFVSLRSSAAATGTLNVYGCGCASPPQYTINGLTVAGWDNNRNAGTCTGDNDVAPHTTHFGNSTNIYNIASLNLSANQNYVWYWDGDVTLEGDGYNGANATSLKGTIIVRGNLTINSSGDMVYPTHVPSNAWQQEQKLLVNTYDSPAAGEYPADAGYHVNDSTFNFGTELFCVPIAGCNEISTVGIKGFVYVGGDLTLTSYLDINGAIWVNGNVTANGGSYTQFTTIWYDDTLSVPTLNVILLRQSWQEVSASSTTWN